MCGIFCEIHRTKENLLNDNKLFHRLMNRGPDHNHILRICANNELRVTFCGTVLWMQGPEITPQPIENEHGVLLYNGDIFDENWNINLNDTKTIMDKLTNEMDHSEQHIINVLKILKGPFSLIYYCKSTQNLYFTRDRIGRSTLLFHKNSESMVISSVLGRKYKCVEIPATGIYLLNLKTKEVKFYPWNNKNSDEQICTVNNWLDNLQKQQSLPDEDFVFEFNIASINSEGDQVLEYMNNITQETNNKLLLMKKLLDNITIRETVLRITELLEKSVKLRVETQPQKCKICLNMIKVCNHCTIGILFSGGLDCTILAFLVDKYLPKNQPIELLNVAFNKEANGSYDVPDRVTGRQSFEELIKVCPTRRWIFKEINVSREELEMHQSTTIADLVYPRQTILDESLGTALWFASRGQDKHSISSCRVLLLGSGADELFGGYTRHRNAYKRKGWLGLQKELYLDWKRISFRNLARDNRVLSDHGRQPRMPYLDEDFTDYVLSLKPWLKCFPSESLCQGVGDKLMLRLVALNIGLTQVVTFPKRALQFGSRIANKKEKGNDISKTFLKNSNINI